MRKGTSGEQRGKAKEKTDENSGHYVIASSRPLERRPLVPIAECTEDIVYCVYLECTLHGEYCVYTECTVCTLVQGQSGAV